VSNESLTFGSCHLEDFEFVGAQFIEPEEGEGKFDFFFLRNFLTQKATGFCRAQNNSLAFRSLRILLRERNSQPLLFAKISKVIKNRTFPYGICHLHFVF
jgi:hypothetical protein